MTGRESFPLGKREVGTHFVREDSRVFNETIRTNVDDGGVHVRRREGVPSANGAPSVLCDDLVINCDDIVSEFGMRSNQNIVDRHMRSLHARTVQKMVEEKRQIAMASRMCQRIFCNTGKFHPEEIEIITLSIVPDRCCFCKAEVSGRRAPNVSRYVPVLRRDGTVKHVIREMMAHDVSICNYSPISRVASSYRPWENDRWLPFFLYFVPPSGSFFSLIEAQEVLGRGPVEIIMYKHYKFLTNHRRGRREFVDAEVEDDLKRGIYVEPPSCEDNSAASVVTLSFKRRSDRTRVNGLTTSGIERSRKNRQRALEIKARRARGTSFVPSSCPSSSPRPICAKLTQAILREKKRIEEALGVKFNDDFNHFNPSGYPDDGFYDKEEEHHRKDVISLNTEGRKSWLLEKMKTLDLELNGERQYKPRVGQWCGLYKDWEDAKYKQEATGEPLLKQWLLVDLKVFGEYYNLNVIFEGDDTSKWTWVHKVTGRTYNQFGSKGKRDK